jgi:hypothetical protein
MNTDQQWMDLENRSSEWRDLEFRNEIGLDVDPSEIEGLAQSVTALAEAMTPSYRNDPDAWSLLSNILVEAQLTPTRLEIQKLSEQHFTFEDILLDGQPVTPYSRARYLYQENDPQKRHDVLSRVANGHPAVDQVLERHNAKRRELAAEWDYTPLDDVLLVEGLHLDQLRKLLTEIATAMRPAFESCFAENREAVLGSNQGEPWEDFVTLYMNRWSAYADRFIPTIDAVTAVRRVVRTMGFEIDAISMDLEDRPRKAPGASAYGVRIPDDVRICVKPVGGVEDLLAIYHEMGHALHFVSIDPNLPYFIRFGFSSGITETFSFWMESLISDPIYLKELGLSERASAELIRFEQLERATFSTWLSVQALCIIDYWTKGPFTLEGIGERLSHYMKQFMGLSVPVNAIRVTGTIARTLDFNTVGYPIAYARLGHLLNQVEAKQCDWWNSPLGVDIVREYMRGGRKAGFPSSLLDIGPFIQRYAGNSS